MRIAIDVAAAVNQRAGIGRYARGVLGAMAALDSGDWVLEVTPRPNASAYEGPPPLPFKRGRRVQLPISERNLWIVWQRMQLPAPPDLLAPRLDVFYNPDFLLPRLAYAPGVCTIHDLGFMTVPECAFPRLRELLLRAVPRSIERARLVMAVSEHTKRDLVRLLGVAPERIRVAGNAADPSFRPVRDSQWLDAERRRLSSALGVELTSDLLLTVGTLEPRKNLVQLFEALAILRERGRSPQLVVAGREGWLYEPIYECVERLKLRDRVIFFHGPTDADLLALYNLAGAMVFPSLYEGFGVPPLEALACGAIVVSSNASSLPEVLGEAALLVDPHDPLALAEAIERAQDDDELRQTLRERGPAQAARFSWDASARSVRHALGEAVR